MVRVHVYRSEHIQQWDEKFSYRDRTGQWYEFDSLTTAQVFVDHRKARGE